MVSKAIRIMWVPVVLSFLYMGWIMWQRYAGDFFPPPTRVERDPLAAYGTSVKILQFYTTKHTVKAGETVVVCYGAVNAKSLRLDPPVEPVWPALSRCFNLKPSKTTRFTLTAEGADHKTASESLEIITADH